MAYNIYRYRWNTITTKALNSQVNPLFPVTILNSGPSTQVDISADSSTKEDLDEVMSSRGWSFIETNPISPTPQTTRQVKSVQLLVDSATISTIFVTLLSININTQIGLLEILATATSNAIIVAGLMRLTLDGVPIANGGSGQLLGIASHTISKRVEITEGNHTIELQWRTDIGGILQIQPVTNPDRENATLLVRETF